MKEDYAATFRGMGNRKLLRLIPHQQSLAERPSHYRCCRRYDRQTKQWMPTEVVCPDGEHDGCSGSIEILHYRRGPTWNASTRKMVKKARRQMLVRVHANGELARRFFSLLRGTVILVEGMMDLEQKVSQAPGRYMRYMPVVEVFSRWLRFRWMWSSRCTCRRGLLRR